MEAFFNYNKPTIYFELLEDENFLISLFDFLDFRTSDNFINDKKLIIEHLSHDIIYNFNVGSDSSDISFKADDNKEFIISGISLVRKENEVTVLLITGSKEKNYVGKVSVESLPVNLEKIDLLKEFNERTDGKDPKPIFIDDNQEYAKTIVACTFDLDTDTISARYVAEEYEHFFTVSTDEIIGFINDKGEYRSQREQEFHEEGIKKVETYGAIIEVAKSALFLPHYLTINENRLSMESHDTELKKTYSNPFTKRKLKGTIGFHATNKPLYVMNVSNEFSPDKIKLRDDLFTVESDGYWKRLGIDEVGLDKKSNVIHGKTWVNQKRVWFEAKRDELVVKKDKKEYDGENSGHIYITRNPLMQEDVFKIGLTRKSVHERMSQLSNTSVPDKFYPVQEWSVYDCVEAEKIIHNLLKDFRVDPRREFFDVQYSKAVSVITEVCNEINKDK